MRLALCPEVSALRLRPNNNGNEFQHGIFCMFTAELKLDLTKAMGSPNGKILLKVRIYPWYFWSICLVLIGGKKQRK